MGYYKSSSASININGISDYIQVDPLIIISDNRKTRKYYIFVKKRRVQWVINFVMQSQPNPSNIKKKIKVK